MTYEKLHKMDFGGNTVWITISPLIVVDPQTNQQKEGDFISAFEIGDEPKMI